jgi:hypothetical protein
MRWSASSRHRENVACHIHAPTPSTTATSADLGTRDRLVLVASESMRHHGYAAKGAKEILTATGAPSGSLDHFFPGRKEDSLPRRSVPAESAYRELVEAYFPAGANLARALETGKL